MQLNYQTKRSLYSCNDNCLLDREIRYCKHKCSRCGFNKAESRKRKGMVERMEFHTNPETGLKGILLPHTEADG